MGNLPRVAQNLKAEALGDKAKSEAMLKAAEDGGTRVKPEFGSVWYHLSGRDRDHGRVHLTLAVPGETAHSLGLPDERTQHSIWILNAGSTNAHRIIHGQYRP